VTSIHFYTMSYSKEILDNILLSCDKREVVVYMPASFGKTEDRVKHLQGYYADTGEPYVYVTHKTKPTPQP
jgi:hypothetical protein